VPQWGDQVSVRPRLRKEEQEEQGRQLLEQLKVGKTAQVYMTGILSNKGRHNGKSVATVAAVLYHKGTEWGRTECPLGKKVTQADVDVEALRPALRLLGNFAVQTNYSGPVELITGSSTAPSLCLDFSQHTMQHVALNCAQSIDTLLTAHPSIAISIQYAKRSPALVGLRRARHLTLDSVKGLLPTVQQSLQYIISMLRQRQL
jgi:hypothetical protein